MFENQIKKLQLEIKRIAENEYGTVEAMCWQLGLTKSTVSYVLNAKHDFRLSTIYKICEALDLDFEISVKQKRRRKTKPPED